MCSGLVENCDLLFWRVNFVAKGTSASAVRRSLARSLTSPLQKIVYAVATGGPTATAAPLDDMRRVICRV